MLISIVIGVVVAGLVLLNIFFATWFHRSAKNEPVAARPEPEPAKLVTKQEAWTERTGYDYQRTSMMGAPVSPIEPGDPDPPEPYE